MLSQDWALLKRSFSQAGFWPKFVLLLAALSLIYASLTSIVYWTPSFGINPSAEPLREGLIGIVVALTALLLALWWQELEANRAPKGAAPRKSAPAGLLGSAIGFFATGCPICQPIWLVWLGLGQASLFLIDLSVWISLASIALLLYSLHVKLNESCRV